MMKRCPECYEVYDAEQNYCDNDGQALLADPTLTLVEENVESNPVTAPSLREAWLTGLVGLMAGILICVAVYVGYSLWSFGGDSGRRESAVSDSPVREPAQFGRSPASSADRSVVDTTEELAEDADAEAETTREPATEISAAPDDQKVAARLNQGPVSTGQRVQPNAEDSGVRTIIQMKDGTTADVDDAWEDSQGVWYRRGGVVSFVESNRVKAITARAEPKSSPGNEAAP